MKTPKYLIENKENIIHLNPEEQYIEYDFRHWDKYFADDEIFQELFLEYPEKVSRKNLFEMSDKLIIDYSFKALKKLFCATMLWGFGTVGYGAYRTNKMLSDENFRSKIEDCYSSIIEGDISKAYKNFELEQCGPAFFTKFFYFSSDKKKSILPIILDSVVSRNLEEKCGVLINNYARVNRRDSSISSITRYQEGYIKYLTDIDSWARDLGIRADKIEYFLFSQR